MTAALAAGSSHFWSSGLRAHPTGLTILARGQADTSSTTVLGVEWEDNWKVQMLKRVVSQVAGGAYLSPVNLSTLVTWINELPDTLPAPAVAVGEDGSVYVEWDIAGNSLHVSFHDDGDEVYFAGDNGDEWEANEVLGVRKVDRAIDRLVAAR